MIPARPAPALVSAKSFDRDRELGDNARFIVTSAIGQGHLIGTVVPGKLADLVLVDGDPNRE